jgi:sulfite reductase alpha subunit-like flavoprotein
MTEMPLSQRVSTIRTMLDQLDAQLSEAKAPPEGLEDLKHTVDTLRTSVWAVLSASKSTNYHALVERFRLRRAIDLIRNMLADMESGKTNALQPEHVELQILSQQLIERIGRLKRA